jgi:hypothetical protein
MTTLFLFTPCLELKYSLRNAKIVRICDKSETTWVIGDCDANAHGADRDDTKQRAGKQNLNTAHTKTPRGTSTYMQLPTHDDVAMRRALEWFRKLGLVSVYGTKTADLLEQDEEEGHQHTKCCEAGEVGHGHNVAEPALERHG